MTMRTELPAARERLERLHCERVLCAVSGGMDSVCLLHFVLEWGRAQGVAVTAAHFNHQLRGEAADRDEAFVRELCRNWQVPCVTGRGDTRSLASEEGRSTEEAARILRYQFLQETAEKTGCQVILTAHHAEDNAETMLLNLVRGTGLRGLAGIPPERENVVRIFWETPREALRAYAEANGLAWVEDETNRDPEAAARNLVRLNILPLLRELNPRAVEHMSRTASQLWEVGELLEAEMRTAEKQAFVSENSVSIPLKTLTALTAPVRAGVLLHLFDLLGTGRRDVGRSHIEALDQLVRRESGQLDLPHGVTALARQGCLCLTRLDRETGRKLLTPGRPCHWGGWVLTLLEEPADEGLTLCAEGAVEVGPCPAGKRLKLPGNRGGRTIKRLCLDRGIDLHQRDSLPAIYVNDHLAAVWRLGVDETFLPEGNARRFIQIFKETEENKHEK